MPGKTEGNSWSQLRKVLLDEIIPLQEAHYWKSNFSICASMLRGNTAKE